MFFGHIDKTEPVSTFAISQNFGTELTTNPKNIEQFLADDIVLYDQALDTVSINQNETINYLINRNFIGNSDELISLKEVVNEDSPVYLIKFKNRNNEFKKTLKLVYKKDKIQSIQYLGNF